VTEELEVQKSLSRDNENCKEKQDRESTLDLVESTQTADLSIDPTFMFFFHLSSSNGLIEEKTSSGGFILTEAYSISMIGQQSTIHP
jgi:hypothetical protein